jgi:hypothetical protein
MPAWLAPYPETTAQTKSFPAYVESTYTTPAAPAAVLDHYRKLFEAAGLTFQPGSDGIGTVIRGAAAECDLLITVRGQAAGTLVRANCAAKSPTYTAVPGPPEVTVTGGRGRPLVAARPPPKPIDHEQAMAEFEERRKAMHPVREDAPAPPLLWPRWLGEYQGGRVEVQRSNDSSHGAYLHARYVTVTPMTALYTYYKELLNANGYPVHGASISTGSTQSGVQQNADGHVEGDNYPDGSPGPHSVIRVSFSRMYLNEPITVDVKFTTFSYEAPRWVKQ